MEVLCSAPPAAAVISVDVALDLSLAVIADLAERQLAIRRDLGVKVSRLFQPEDGVSAAAVVYHIDPGASALERLGYNAESLRKAAADVGRASEWLGKRRAYEALPSGFRARLEAFENVIQETEALAEARMILGGIVGAVVSESDNELREKVQAARVWAANGGSIGAEVVNIVCSGDRSAQKFELRDRAALAAWSVAALRPQQQRSGWESRPALPAMRIVKWDVSEATARAWIRIAARLRIMELHILIAGQDQDGNMVGGEMPHLAARLMNLAESARGVAVTGGRRRASDRAIAGDVMALARGGPWLPASVGEWEFEECGWRVLQENESVTDWSVGVIVNIGGEVAQLR